MENKTILVFNPKIARHLLRMGHPIIDIKADKENTDRTIFVFNRSKEILDIIHSF